MVPVPGFHIVGAGKVAQTLATLWQHSGRYCLHGVWSRNPASAQQLLERVAGGQYCADIHTLPEADIVVVGVKDDAIEAMDAMLANLPWLSAQTTVLHFSGAHSSRIFRQLLRKGVSLGSLHPVYAFAEVTTALAQLRGHFCAVEGDASALPLLHDLAATAGLQPFAIAAQDKSRYHAALSVSANYLVTLNAYARSILINTGLPETVAAVLVHSLMQQNLNQLADLPPQQALTGPIVRGDAATVAAHLKVLSASEQPLYRVLGMETARLAQARVGLADTQAMLDLLSGKE